MPKDVDVKWLDGFVLYFVNKTWGQDVYDAIWTKQKFRLIVDGNIIASVPKATPGSHQATDTTLWGTKDLEFDDAGCLTIKDKHLGNLIVAAHGNGAFDVAMPGASGPIGENKINAMCPC